MAKKKNKDISFEDLEALMNDGNFEQMMQEMMNERMKAFKKREVPEVRSIVNSLQSLQKLKNFVFMLKCLGIGFIILF